MKIGTFDIEADGIGEDVSVVWCGTVKDHETGEVRSFEPHEIETGLIPHLETFDVLSGHNCIKYDFYVLRKLLGFHFKGRVVDTLIRSRLQRPNRQLPKTFPKGVRAGPHSVAAWGWRLGRQKIDYDEWHHYTPEMLHRNVEDVEIQHQIFLALQEEADGENWEHAHRLTEKLFWYLQRQEEYGWQIDRAKLDKSLYFLDRWISLIDDAVRPYLPIKLEVEESKKDGEYSWVKKPFKKDGSFNQNVSRWLEENGLDLNIAGPFSRVKFRKLDLSKTVEVKDYLLNLGWQPVEWNVDSHGKRSSPKLSKDDPFDGVRGSIGRLISKRVQCRQRKGIVEGWSSNIRADGRIATPVSGIASTGRIKHAVVANVPSSDRNTFFAKWMRQIFVASPGMVMVGVDSKGNQMRQLGARMNDPEFLDAVINGSKEEGTDEHSLTQKKTNLPNRNIAKTANYSIIFGAQAKKISNSLNVSVKEGDRIKNAVLDSFPGLRKLIEELTDVWKTSAKRVYIPQWGRYQYENGYITGLDGRPVLVDKEHKILNYQLQSDEAIQMTAAYCWFCKQVEKRGYVHGVDWGMLIFYHDEFQFECRPEIAEELRQLAEYSIKWAGKYFKINCPHEGEGKIGMNWMDCH